MTSADGITALARRRCTETFQHTSYGRRAHPVAEAGQLPLDAVVSPAGFSRAIRSISAASRASSGGRLHVRSLGGGSAPQIGAPCTWRPRASTWSRSTASPPRRPRRRLVGYDQRGAGRSSRPDGDFILGAQLADLDAVRRWTGAEKVDLVGASWGGLIAAAYAAQMPTHVLRLILLDPAPLDLNEFLARQRRFGDRQLQLQRAGFVPDPLNCGFTAPGRSPRQWRSVTAS